MAKFTRKDFPAIAEYICDQHSKRKREREDLERQWKDIDRQIRMEPDRSHKLNSRGQRDPDLEWMPEMELPNQAQTLEVLSADAIRMQFPDSGSWFSAHAEMTDKLLDKVDFSSIILGDEAEVPSQINQDNLDKLVQGAHLHWQRQYDFSGHVSACNGEAFKYGIGVARGKLVKKRVLTMTAKGVEKEEAMIPVLLPRSIKKTYLDDSPAMVMNEGHMVGPAVIEERWQNISDLRMSSRGGSDPRDDNGGWIHTNLKNLDGNKNGLVQLLEFEGDVIVPRKTTNSIYIPNAIVLVAVGESGGKAVSRMVRLRFRKLPFSSYILFPYHKECVETSYAASPLMKGRPIQIAAVDALNRMIMTAALSAQPPVQWDSDDQNFAKTGGPRIHPAALWGSVGQVVAHNIGNLAEIQAVYIALLQQYSDVTGVNAPRLGAQTISHTTAFAKDVENTRGQARTVNYARNSLKGPLHQWLQMEYRLGRDNFKKHPMYISEYGGFVEVGKEFLPQNVSYEVHGSGGPQEEQAKRQQRMQALTLALQMDQMAVQAGIQPTILPNLPDAIRQVLREGGWTDTDLIAGDAPVSQEPSEDQGMGQLVGLLAGAPAA